VSIAQAIRTAAPLCSAEWAAALEKAMPSRGISTGPRMAMFLAQCAHESAGFARFVENLNYSAERLVQVFPRYFKSMLDADRYAHQPTLIANRVYASRMGNGDEKSGDGWRFRGRGCIQLTGRFNYNAAAIAIRYPLLTMPDSLTEPTVGAAAAAWFWESRACNAMADKGDFTGITRAINGGLNGLEDRKRWLQKMNDALG
jgi:putative chitinase